MKTRILYLGIAILTSLTSCQETQTEEIEPVKFSEVKVQDDFWSPILKKHKDVTLGVCIDQIENQTGRMRNFENAASGEGKHSGIFFDDSDVYKALEGMAYSLQNNPDKELEAKCDEWIDKFAAAQQPDGYLNTYYTLTGLENRWTDMNMHEMYCAGHMIEAAVAYYNVTGKRKLLDVSCKFVNHMMDTFGLGKRDWVPGHEEIELALVKLSDVTGKKEYLEFADWLLSERGKGLGIMEGKPWNTLNYQDDKPVTEMTDIAGHAVRAMYLYCGMADVAKKTGKKEYIDAISRLWEDVVLRNMYITGGIGSSKHNEGFTEDYDLPNKEAYCETCASIGMVLWNWRMFLQSGNSKYIDTMERSLYNGVLAGYSLQGDKFFYVNPLESDGKHHRKSWYGCACCPSNICRFIPSIGGYILAHSCEAIWVNTFISSESDFMTIQTNYPWEGNVTITLKKAATSRKTINLRIPSWCKEFAIEINGKKCESIPSEKGYAVLSRNWKKGDVITLRMEMPVEIVAADSHVKEDLGKRAVCRGPLVYCMEETDNKDSYDNAKLQQEMQFNYTFDKNLLGGVTKISSIDNSMQWIPYFAWDNREAGRMKVWIEEQENKLVRFGLNFLRYFDY